MVLQTTTVKYFFEENHFLICSYIMEESFATSISQLPIDQQHEMWNIVKSNIQDAHLDRTMYMQASIILAGFHREQFIEDMRDWFNIPIQFISNNDIYNTIISECQRLMIDPNNTDFISYGRGDYLILD